MCHAGYSKFGEPIEKGDICYRKAWGSLLEAMFGNKASVSWEYNFSLDTFKRKFGQAVRFADDLQANVFEWRRRLLCRSGQGGAICCPEDVRPNPATCKHDRHTVCQFCEVPLCN